MKQHLASLRSRIRQSGLQGLIDLIDEPDHGLLTRFLLAVDKKFIGFAQFARYFASLENQVDERTFSDLAEELLDYLALELNYNHTFEELSTPGQPAIIMGLNHESIVEPVFLASLLDRNDIAFFGMAVTQFIGPQVAKFILPVMPRRSAVDYQPDKKRSLSDRLNWVYWVYGLDKRTLEEVEQLNKQSIEGAAAHIDRGGILMIFPGGGVDIRRPWYRGLGEILSLVSPEILHATAVVPVSTTGLSRKTLYKKVHQSSFDRRQPYTVQGTVFDPIYIPPSKAGLTPEQLLDYLKEETLSRRTSHSRDTQVQNAEEG